MKDDLSVKWTLANPLTIQTDDSGNAWNAGAARDIVALDEDRVLVATDTGGIWMANRDGSSSPVADVDYPDFWCITSGQYGNDHFYAGGSKLYETDISKSLPLLNWREIPVTWEEKGGALGTGTGGFGKIVTTVSPSAIYKIAILREDKRIVLATTNGVVWADIPLPPKRPSGCLHLGGGKGSSTSIYKWKKAIGLEDTAMGYLGLAIGVPKSGEIERSISVASWGASGEPMQFYRGEWEGSELMMKKARMDTVNSIDNSMACATTMTSCETHPERMYAISSNDQGFVAMFWISTDDGRKWTPLNPKLIDLKYATFTEAAQNLGNSAGRPCNCIAASRQKPDTVAVGWRIGGFFVSEDAGKTWRLTDTANSQHTHSDVHSIYFDPTDSTGERILRMTAA